MKKKTITIKAKVYKPKSKTYPKKPLAEGTKVEKEHTPSKKLAETIAKNHLDEDKSYYKKLKKVEKKK
jgi:hypothetical protein